MKTLKQYREDIKTHNVKVDDEIEIPRLGVKKVIGTKQILWKSKSLIVDKCLVKIALTDKSTGEIRYTRRIFKTDNSESVTEKFTYKPDILEGKNETTPIQETT